MHVLSYCRVGSKKNNHAVWGSNLSFQLSFFAKCQLKTFSNSMTVGAPTSKKYVSRLTELAEGLRPNL